MQIMCLTTAATWEVVQILQHAGLRIRRDFHFDGPNLPDPPVILILHVAISSEVACQLLNIAGVMVVGSTTPAV